MKKIFLTSLLVLLALQFSYSQDGNNAWTKYGSNLGRIYCGVINPVNQNIIYVAGLDSGVFKSTNGGLNWAAVNNGLNSKSIQCIAIAPSDPNVLYVGTNDLGTAGTNGVYKTTNGGSNWTLVIGGLTEFAVQSMVVHTTNPNTVWACIFNGVAPAAVGLWKTTNGGTNWFVSNTGIASDNKNVLSLAINPLNSNVLYVGTSLILPGNRGPSKIYKSYDGGANWNLMSTGLPTDTTDNNPVRCLEVLKSDTSKIGAALFVNALTGGFFLSTNGGQSWTRKHEGLPAAVGSLLRSLYMRSANEYYVGMDGGTTTKGVWRTTNGGNNWVEFNNNALYNVHPVRMLLLKTSGDTTLFAGTSGTVDSLKGIYGYTWPAPPQPSTWTAQVSPLTTALQSVSVPNDDVAWACGVSGKVVRTTNKGITWTNVSGTISTTYSLVNIFALDANTCLVTGYNLSNTIMYRTTDGGTTWATVYGPATGFIDNIYMTDANNAYYIGDPVGGAWDLKKSTNGGVNWTTWSTLTTTNTSGTYNNAGCFLGTNVWFSGNGDNSINYSSNMGANWTSQPNAQAELGAIWFNSPTNGMIGGFTGSLGVKYTTNSGVNWTAVTNPASIAIIAITGSGNEYWVASQGLNIYYTSNSGANWTTSYTAPAGSVYAMQKARTGNTIFAVRSNGGISRYGTPITGISVVGSEVPTSYSVSQNYPNPFNPTTKINFALPKSGLVTMKVYDILGKEVATLVNEVRNAGSYTVDFNASNLTSGTYFYRIESNEFIETKKMMLIK